MCRKQQQSGIFADLKDDLNQKIILIILAWKVSTPGVMMLQVENYNLFSLRLGWTREKKQ